MPGLMVREELPLRFTAVWTVPPVTMGNPASGSPVAPGVPVLVTLAFPLLLTLPITSTPYGAVTLALPLARMALEELESTTTSPAILMLAFPERLRAPPADPSRTKTDAPAGLKVTVSVPVLKV